MAIGMSLRWENGTQDQYEAVHRAMGIAENPPDGLIVHSAGPVHGGWGVTDFWESRAQFDAFVESRLMPTMQKVENGLDAPDAREFPVHNFERF
jgi:hypothetical protein